MAAPNIFARTQDVQAAFDEISEQIHELRDQIALLNHVVAGLTADVYADGPYEDDDVTVDERDQPEFAGLDASEEEEERSYVELPEAAQRLDAAEAEDVQAYVEAAELANETGLDDHA